MPKKQRFLKVLAVIGIAASIVWGDALRYRIISPHGTGFMSVKIIGDDPVIYNMIKFSEDNIQEVIDAIKSDAAGKDCSIDFDNIDFGNKGISFYNPEMSVCDGIPGVDCPWFVPFDPGSLWGKITITGNITSSFWSYDYSNQKGVIVIDGVSVEIAGRVENNAIPCPEGYICPAVVTYSHAINKKGRGELTIAGGWIYSQNGNAIKTDGASKVVIESRGIWSSFVTSHNAAAIYIGESGNPSDTALVIGGLINELPVDSENRGINNGGNNIVEEQPYLAIISESASKMVFNSGRVSFGAVVAHNQHSDLILNGSATKDIYSKGNVFLGSNGIWSSRVDGGITVEKEKLHVIDGFNPGDNLYYLLNAYSNGDIAVVDGAAFIDNFRISDNQTLEVSGNDIIVKNNGTVSLAKSANSKTTKFAFAGIRNGQINLQLQAGNYTAELYDLRGRMISKVEISAINGVNASGLKTDKLSKGVFILNVKQAGSSVLQQKISVK